MRKVLVFWSIILIVLIVGVTAIIYGRLLRKEEERKADILVQELMLPRAPRIAVPPSDMEIEDKIGLPESLPPLDIESPEVLEGPELLEGIELPELPEVPETKAAPPSPPGVPEIPTLPAMPTDVDILEAPELHVAPEATGQ